MVLLANRAAKRLLTDENRSVIRDAYYLYTASVIIAHKTWSTRFNESRMQAFNTTDEKAYAAALRLRDDGQRAAAQECFETRCRLYNELIDTVRATIGKQADRVVRAIIRECCGEVVRGPEAPGGMGIPWSK